MAKKPNAQRNKRTEIFPAKSNGMIPPKSIQERCREYQRQIEVFEARNTSGAYDAILHYLKAEVEKLKALDAVKDKNK